MSLLVSLENRHMNVVSLSALRTGNLYPPQEPSVTVSTIIPMQIALGLNPGNHGNNYKINTSVPTLLSYSSI
jgi:hypothetical protein